MFKESPKDWTANGKLKLAYLYTVKQVRRLIWRRSRLQISKETKRSMARINYYKDKERRVKSADCELTLVGAGQEVRARGVQAFSLVVMLLV